jgi:hypothetical protein
MRTAEKMQACFVWRRVDRMDVQGAGDTGNGDTHVEGKLHYAEITPVIRHMHTASLM